MALNTTLGAKKLVISVGSKADSQSASREIARLL
jgi:hypothetical protein